MTEGKISGSLFADQVIVKEDVTVDSVSEAPDNVVVKYDEERGLYYRRECKKSLIEKPFADYDDFDHCTTVHSDKEDPEAYCAQIHYEATGEWPSEKQYDGIPVSPNEEFEYDPADKEDKVSGSVSGAGQALKRVLSEVSRLQQFEAKVTKEMSKDSFGVDIFRIVATEDMDTDFSEDVLAIGTVFPNHDVFVDWRTEAWPDGQELTGPHVSIYSSIEDVEDVAQGEIEYLTTIDGEMTVDKVDSMQDISPDDIPESVEDVRVVEQGNDYVEVELPDGEVVSFFAAMPLIEIREIFEDIFRKFGAKVVNSVASNVMQHLPDVAVTVGSLIGLSDEDEVEEYLSKVSGDSSASSGSSGTEEKSSTVSQPLFGAEQTGVSQDLFEKTPEGVPEDADYVAPGQEPPEGAEVVESPHGATYVVSTEGESEETSSPPDPRTQDYGYDDYETPDPADIDSVQLDLDVAPAFGDRTKDAMLKATSYLEDKDLLDGVDTVGGEPPPNRPGVPFAAFDPTRDYVFVEPQQVSPELVGMMHDDNGLAGDQIEDVVNHEVVHSLHWQDLSVEEAEELTQADVPDEEQEWLEENISSYAAKNPMEVVAEIGSLLLKGEDLSDEALELYDKYGGPEL